MIFRRRHLQALAVAALQRAGTLAGEKVFPARTWPTMGADLPALLVHVPRDEKQSLGRGAPQFDTAMHLMVIGRVQAARSQVEADIERLAEQIEDAILTDRELIAELQQVLGVQVEVTVTSEAKQHVGEAALTFTCEVFQCWEPPPGEPLERLTVEFDISEPADGRADTALQIDLPASTAP